MRECRMDCGREGSSGALAACFGVKACERIVWRSIKSPIESNLHPQAGAAAVHGDARRYNDSMRVGAVLRRRQPPNPSQTSKPNEIRAFLGLHGTGFLHICMGMRCR
eukprot:366348-Chlamydomonas_euryale.AAC.5